MSIKDYITINEESKIIRFNIAIDFHYGDHTIASGRKSDFRTSFSKIVIDDDNDIIMIYSKEKCNVSSKYENDLKDFIIYKNNRISSKYYPNEGKMYLMSIEDKYDYLILEYEKKLTLKLLKPIYFTSQIRDAIMDRYELPSDCYFGLLSNEFDPDTIKIVERKTPLDVFKAEGQYKLIETEEEFQEYMKLDISVDDYCTLKLIRTLKDLNIADSYIVVQLLSLIGFDYDKFCLLKKYNQDLNLDSNDLGYIIINKLNKEKR